MTPRSQDLFLKKGVVDLVVDDKVHAFDFHSFIEELCVVGECAEVMEERMHSLVKEKFFALERLKRKLQDPPTGSFD